MAFCAPRDRADCCISSRQGAEESLSLSVYEHEANADGPRSSRERVDPLSLRNESRRKTLNKHSCLSPGLQLRLRPSHYFAT